ncbi:MAG: 1-acyl-sn-glycerol-3-phosphate acyltransferase [Holophagales bacterium]|nr:1-acyl-sn-glycerol-3-phosphate acyltransferase [Holophagales bacterium]
MASTFYTVLGNAVLVLATAVFGPLASVFGWLPPRGRWMYLCARLWSRVYLWGSGVRLRSVFEEPLDSRCGYIFMANHQSMYDIPALIAGMPGEVRFLAKKSLFKIPVFGWALSAGGFVPVDRGNRQAASETYQRATRILESGRSILIFPEETRSADGRLLPFKRGGAVLAAKTGFPIVPVGIRGTRDVRPKGSLLVHPGPVVVRYGKPIEVEGHDAGTRDAALTRVRSAIEGLIEPESEAAPARWTAPGEPI